MQLRILAALATAAPALAATFNNPVVFSDFPDNDVSKGPDGAYYFSASSFQFSPGAPIMKSTDLVNWELIGHSVPDVAAFGSTYELNTTGNPSYVGGVWASTMRYRKSNNKWYWIGCVGFSKTYVYTSSNVASGWELSSTINTCYYDCGLLIDDDDSMYVVYGSKTISIAKLSADGLSQVSTKEVFSAPSGMSTIEGSRLYKIGNYYYVLGDNPGGITLIWRSTSLYGSWEYQILQKGISGPVGGLIDQGSLVEAADGNWYFMSCSWSYPAGRVPLLAPITWSNGWPKLTTSSTGAWAASYPAPGALGPTTKWTGTDSFDGNALSSAWEWNFSPVTSKYKVSNGLTLYTATVTDDLYKASNTLTHRLDGGQPIGTMHMDFSNMADGDKAGLAAFRDQTAFLAVTRSGGTYTLSMVAGATQSTTDWKTTSTGTVKASVNLPRGSVYLRVAMDVRPSGSKTATFYYSTDGNSFKQLGTSYALTTSWSYFTGYRYGLFNFATKALGGSVKVISFTSSNADETTATAKVELVAAVAAKVAGASSSASAMGTVVTMTRPVSQTSAASHVATIASSPAKTSAAAAAASTTAKSCRAK
ncbi:hypothetical protein TD95_000414 [Thielaviopsis punctulata]|uniref:Beta-xylosidase C-terminal Concanavalin A-like domain-containing protein n=1 Tax=Thielaviopsis punctulata TaxID=72032 RepID=A0A0F4ZGX1_9PEZI|nr:hypothetical protein TD95_000414 [Thielaviopsis punctulata]